MANIITKDIEEVKVNRLPVPFNLNRKQYLDLKWDYVDSIVASKIKLKKVFDTHREALREVISCRRKLNDAEARLVEVYERLEDKKIVKK